MRNELHATCRLPLHVFRLLIIPIILAAGLLAFAPGASAQTAIGTIAVGTNPEGTCVNKATNKVYVANDTKRYGITPNNTAVHGLENRCGRISTVGS